LLRTDIALPDIAQPRGVAGTLFVHKIAGHRAEQGESLDAVFAAAQQVASSTRSYGVALDTCTIPGTEKEARIEPSMAELGLGIHGEPGVEMVSFESASKICNTVMDALFKDQDTHQSHVVLLNNLGAATPLELQSLANTILSGPYANRIVGVIGPALLMTSLDMHGFSVSILPVTDAYSNALQAPCEPDAWPAMQMHSPVAVQALPDSLSPIRHTPSADDAVRGLIVDSCQAFASMEADLNALDVKTGDGDTGSTLGQAARSLHDVVDTLPLANQTELLRAISDHLSVSMGGSSGVLLAILFSAAGDASAGGKSAQVALRAGLEKMMQYGGAEVGHRTMVDALVPALDALVAGASLGDAAAAARQGANSTQTMTRARSGRSAYVPETALVGVTDPGAEGVARYFEALAARA